MMDLTRQWCAQPDCVDFGQVGASNIKVHSYVEQRLYCATCLHTFSADTGTFFETIRTARAQVLDALALLTERNSLRAVERLETCPHNTLLHWLALSGQHLSALSDELLNDLRVSQVQIDELWTFVKKSRPIYIHTIRRNGGIAGSGVRWLCRVACGSSVISAMNAVRPLRSHF